MVVPVLMTSCHVSENSEDRAARLPTQTTTAMTGQERQSAYQLT